MAVRSGIGVMSFLGFSIFQGARSQGHLDHCTAFSDNSLQVIMSDVVHDNVCDALDVDFDVMMEHCVAFCGAHAVPVVVGTDTVGFPLDEINGVCRGNPSGDSDDGDDDVIIRHDPDKMANCEEWSRALNEVALKAADFIASVNELNMEQMHFRISMQESVHEVQEVMQSEETQTAMNLARADRKLEQLTQILQDNLADIMGDGILKRRLRQKLDNLKAKSELLQAVIRQNLPLVRRYVEECNELLLATGPSNEYLLDICSVTSAECIDSVDDGQSWGRHSACCCGMVPAIGHFDIPATRLGSRRLQEEQESVDVCGQAYEVGAQNLREARAELCELPGGTEFLREFEDNQREQYPDYFADCSRRMQEVQKNDIPPPDVPSAERQLQELYLTCSPPSSSTNANMIDPLKVAFWEHTETALCKDIIEDGVTMTNPRLSEVCQSFCGEGLVSFTLGTTAFGFSQEQLDSVCLVPEEQPYAAEFVDDCHIKALAFQRLQAKTSHFAGQLDILQAARMKFEADSAVAVNEFRDLIKSEAAAVVDNAALSDKIHELKALFHTALSDIIATNSRTKRELHDEAETLQLRTEELSEALDEIVPQLESFVDNCNVLVTGVGPDDEYLLDMCSQTSRECVEAPEGFHVGCCCGYNPVTTLGLQPHEVSAHQTIPGLDAAEFGQGGPRTRTGRRLQGSAYDICAEASRASTREIEEYIQEVRDLGADHLIESAHASHQDLYPSYHNRCEDLSSCRTTTTTAEAANDEQSITESQATDGEESSDEPQAAGGNQQTFSDGVAAGSGSSAAGGGAATGGDEESTAESVSGAVIAVAPQARTTAAIAMASFLILHHG